jgi:biopolymer transport protein TolQ
MKTNSFSIIDLILHADIVVQSIMLFLIIFSLWSWAIIFDKIIKFRILEKRTNKFEGMFRKNSMLEDLYNEAKENDDHPLAFVFIGCMKEWKSNNIRQIIDSGYEKKSSLKERLSAAMQVSSNRSMEKLESGLNFLAMVSSVAPFIGLFGTVWGIMNSFQGIAATKNTSLSVVAPGIAESLLATGIGLFVAIPSVLFYNIFSTKINQFYERMNNFSVQIFSILSRELDR